MKKFKGEKMKKSEKMTEEILLKNKSIDELIRIKMQEELKNAFNKRVGKQSKVIIKNIKDVPVEKIFTKKAVFRVFNKETQIETLINGLQAEALLGMQNDVREKFKRKETDIFSTDTLFVKFESIEL